MARLYNTPETATYRRNVEKIKTFLATRTWTYVREIWSECLGFPIREYDQSGGTLISLLLTKECDWQRTNTRKRIRRKQEWLYRPKSKDVDFADVLG